MKIRELIAWLEENADPEMDILSWDKEYGIEEAEPQVTQVWEHVIDTDRYRQFTEHEPTGSPARGVWVGPNKAVIFQSVL